MILVILQMYPEHFSFESGSFDLHMGTNKTRLALLLGQTPVDIMATWQAGLQTFAKERQPYLLYT